MPRHQLHHQFRDAIRASGSDAAAIAIQAKVPREQLAALLRGADHCSLQTLHSVASRLGLSLRLECAPTLNHPVGPVETIVDQARRKLATHQA